MTQIPGDRTGPLTNPCNLRNLRMLWKFGDVLQGEDDPQITQMTQIPGDRSGPLTNPYNLRNLRIIVRVFGCL